MNDENRSHLMEGDVRDQKTHRDTSGEELTRGTLSAQQSIRMNLSAAQLHDHESEPSWKAPREKRGISNAALIAIIVITAILILISLKVAGVI
jgi:hypothetical protein